MSDAALDDPTPTTLVVQTVSIDDPGVLAELLPREDNVAWIRGGDGIVGWGRAAHIDTSGPERFSDAQLWWSELSNHVVVRDAVRAPGSGLVAFGSFGFADSPGDSVLIVPEIIVGRRGDTSWVTTISAGGISSPPAVEPADAPNGPDEVVFADGPVSGTQWETIVAEAVRRINGGDLDKVVLARDLIAELDNPLDVRWPLQRLSQDYPLCWTFHVDGLFGATPEMLVRRERGLVTSRVLAGTIRRTGDDEHDLALAASLARSSKDLEEHEYAVRSVADALAPHCTSMNVPESPFVLHLPNVMHLATDVAGVIDPDLDAEDASALGLAAALHPSAAVGGTPTDIATTLIDEIEGMDRRRYAGPVGWINADGDGEWGIALRSAEVSKERPTRVRLFAGCGIVADSDPEAELAESQAKFVPVRDALGR